jgi:hypothetical protein
VACHPEFRRTARAPGERHNLFGCIRPSSAIHVSNNKFTLPLSPIGACHDLANIVNCNFGKKMRYYEFKLDVYLTSIYV